MSWLTLTTLMYKTEFEKKYLPMGPVRTFSSESVGVKLTVQSAHDDPHHGAAWATMENDEVEG